MATDNVPKAFKPPASNDSPSPDGSSVQPHLPTPARDGSDKSKPYLLAVNTFKGGQDYSAKPSAYEKRRATETMDDDEQIGPAITVRFTIIKDPLIDLSLDALCRNFSCFFRDKHCCHCNCHS